MSIKAVPEWKRPEKQAAVAHTDLNIFAAVVVLLESSLQSSACSTSAQQIIRIAQHEQQRCLRRFDDAMAKLKDRP